MKGQTNKQTEKHITHIHSVRSKGPKLPEEVGGGVVRGSIRGLWYFVGARGGGSCQRNLLELYERVSLCTYFPPNSCCPFSAGNLFILYI